jgi:hypothetical protein
MLEVHPFSSSTRISVSDTLAVLSPVQEDCVQRVWQAEFERREGKLFNGRLLGVVSVTPALVRTRMASYSHWLAQRAQPALFADATLRPLAVSGVLHCPQGFVFGLREQALTQDGGLWELVPSGGLDPDCVVQDGRADPLAQLMIELTEETGLEPSAIVQARPYCLLESRQSQVFDIGIELWTGLSAQEIVSRHDALQNREYSELRVVAADHLDESLQQLHPGVVAASIALLQCLRGSEGRD